MDLAGITHFTKLEYLEKIISEKRFIPRYNLEEVIHTIDGANSLQSFCIPMVCFCDLDVNIELHMSHYGNVGIGFGRSWAIKNELIPVMYIDRNTKLVSRLRKLFEDNAFQYQNSNENNINTILDNHFSLFELTLFTKPYEGYFKKIKENKVFYWEREWRRVPIRQPQVEYSLRPDILEERNNELIRDQTSHLFFVYVDIKCLYANKDSYCDLKSFLAINGLDDLINKIELV